MVNRVDSPPPVHTPATRWHPWADFLVETFGSLIPGLVFTAAMAVTSGWPLMAFAQAVSGKPITQPLLDHAKLLDVFKWEVLVIGLCLSYVFGHIFFRQDPKNTDKASFRKLQKRAYREAGRGEDLTLKLRKDYACDKPENCQFPYEYLDVYLQNRGLNHLAWFVRWKDQRDWRSKIYINLLKIRIMVHAPDKYSAIARNEGHVRLMSSTWHLCRTLSWASLGVLATYGVWIAVRHWAALFQGVLPPAVPPELLPLLPTLLVLVSAVMARRAIEVPFHYQRLREIIFVLETAQTLFADTPEILTCDGAFPEFSPKPRAIAPSDGTIPRCFGSRLARDARCDRCTRRAICN